jgi:hypothetical protein
MPHTQNFGHSLAGTRHGRVKALSDDRRYQTRARDPPDLHRAPASAHARLCQLERAETAGHSPPADHKALSADAAADALDDFERGPWGPKFRPALRPGAAFGRTSFVLRLSPTVRRVVYTTNALESVHAQLRKIIKTRAERRGSHSADLARVAERHQEMGSGGELLEGGDNPVRDSLRGTLHQAHGLTTRVIHEKFRILPVSITSNVCLRNS